MAFLFMDFFGGFFGDFGLKKKVQNGTFWRKMEQKSANFLQIFLSAQRKSCKFSANFF